MSDAPLQKRLISRFLARLVSTLRVGAIASPGYLAPVAVTFLLTLPLWAPWSVWPLAYVAFVPWLLLVCSARSAGGIYLASYVLGLAFFFMHWRWLFETTGPGYFAGCIAFALYFVLAAWIVRHLYRRRRIPVTFGFATAWILVEIMRSHGPLGFPWFLLGHTQIRLLSLVQIADITGVYGISFAVAMVNGLVADLLLRALERRLVVRAADSRFPASDAGRPTAGSVRSTLRAWPTAPVVVIATFAGLFGYGWYRLTTLEIKPGPTVAVLQADALLKAEEDPGYNWAKEEHKKQQSYLSQFPHVFKSHPDLVTLPETPWSMTLNREFREMDPHLLRGLSSAEQASWQWAMRNGRQWYEYFRNQSRIHDATIVVGALSQEKQPAGAYPSELRYNSAFVFDPDGTTLGRYDKIHPVLFGEYVPFRYSIPWLYRWLNENMTPFGQGGYEYSLTAGHEFRVFKLHERHKPDEPHGFGVTICYEDVIPHVFRRFILDSQGNKRVGFMLNISNDGWFGHGAQQPQHLVNCAFRAIENRVGVARSVNTGVSGFIRPDGSWHDLVTHDPKRPTAGGSGYRIARIDTSPAVTLYSRAGDAFGGSIALLGCLAALDAVVARRREKQTLPETSHDAKTT